MIKIAESNDGIAYDINSYICDKETDVQDLPVRVGMGSTAFVIETSEIYMLNGEKVWVKI